MLKLTAILLIASFVILSCAQQREKIETKEHPMANPEMETNDLTIFGRKYAEAWCSQIPDRVASFYAENGSLKVNNGPPSVGREAIAKSAEGFMTSFPDMVVTMDSLVAKPEGVEFHWTLTGTNTGPNGTGKKVSIRGFELWQINEVGLVGKSIGSFDTAEYNRQLQYGVGK